MAVAAPSCPDWLKVWADRFTSGEGLLLVVTGAGISAESGIPTFRGKHGYWVIGSSHYAPEAMATQAMFRNNPEAFWLWYLQRFSLCFRARPNAAHEALARLERHLGLRLLLVTQNIDGLHLRAGHDEQRLYRIHGDVHWLRCGRPCHDELRPLPKALSEAMGRDDFAAETWLGTLRCEACGHWLRPHVLLFDEMYDERWFRFQSSLMAVNQAHTLLSVGTTGATNLPYQLLERAQRRRISIIDVNTDSNVFADAARQSTGGALQGSATTWLPLIAELLHAT
jgi:NAD-dependent deacetylase